MGFDESGEITELRAPAGGDLAVDAGFVAVALGAVRAPGASEVLRLGADGAADAPDPGLGGGGMDVLWGPVVDELAVLRTADAAATGGLAEEVVVCDARAVAAAPVRAAPVPAGPDAPVWPQHTTTPREKRRGVRSAVSPQELNLTHLLDGRARWGLGCRCSH